MFDKALIATIRKRRIVRRPDIDQYKSLFGSPAGLEKQTCLRDIGRIIGAIADGGKRAAIVAAKGAGVGADRTLEPGETK